jgi:hypothetical protein
MQLEEAPEKEFDIADFSDLKSWQKKPTTRGTVGSVTSRSKVSAYASKLSKTSEGAVRRLNPKMINTHNRHKFNPAEIMDKYSGPETERLSNLKNKLFDLKNPRMTLKTMGAVKTPYVIISEHQNKLLKGMTRRNKGLTIPLTPPPEPLPSI